MQQPSTAPAAQPRKAITADQVRAAIEALGIPYLRVRHVSIEPRTVSWEELKVDDDGHAALDDFGGIVTEQHTVTVTR